jgi:hypothetical protein
VHKPHVLELQITNFAATNYSPSSKDGSISSLLESGQWVISKKRIKSAYILRLTFSYCFWKRVTATCEEFQVSLLVDEKHVSQVFLSPQLSATQLSEM